MTIDEVIEHAREKAQEHRRFEKMYKEFSKEDGDVWEEQIADCIEHAEEHEQLASWLEELKEYKKLNIVHCKDCMYWGTGVYGETDKIKCCEYSEYMVGANGYCVYGEKWSEENE